ncbi:cell wall-associated NlpC family hydrolase [Kitasatospora sp. MAA19]|uniref:C40 family peptidase n=1 Tax=unclassified Kitasatospora TaxID=2633591 RepID=UPI002473DADD|nr:C40 family peptidase [Kitasatospora sp. MAA19]MDH6709176.1 cell wall-associated NlpC family hydrolase [Kitasatospora sp. MAA19]
MKKAVGALIGVVAAGPLVLALPVAIVAAGSASTSTSNSCPSGGNPQGVDSTAVAAQVEAILKGSSPLSAPAVAGLSKPSEQIPNARTIQATGVAMHIPVRGQVVALATALQESELRNVNGGDRDSLGLFQQRPSQGWGTPEQIMQPVYASTKFYEALQKVSGWESMTVTQAAQAVQRSGFPDAYARWQPLAEALQKALAPLLDPASSTSPNPTPAPTAGASAGPAAGGGCGTPTAGGDGSDFGTIPAGSLPNGYTIPADAPQPVQTAIRWALGQLGTPYQWGGTCASSHGADPMGRCDCSSLMQMAYRSAGVSLERTTYDQVKQGTAVSADSLKPGDLLFTRGTAAVPEHVGMFIGSGLIVHAPKTGDVVKISTLASWRPEILAARRVA